MRGQGRTVDKLRSLGAVLQVALQRVCALVVRAADGRDGRLIDGVGLLLDVGVDGLCHHGLCGVVLACVSEAGGYEAKEVRWLAVRFLGLAESKCKIRFLSEIEPSYWICVKYPLFWRPG